MFDKNPSRAKISASLPKTALPGAHRRPDADGIQSLQRIIGNRAVAQMVRNGEGGQGSEVNSIHDTSPPRSAESDAPTGLQTHSGQHVIQRVVRWDNSWNFTAKSLYGLLTLGHFGIIGRRKTRIQNGMMDAKRLIGPIQHRINQVQTIQPVDQQALGILQTLKQIVADYDEHDITYEQGIALDRQLGIVIPAATRLLNSEALPKLTKTKISTDDDLYKDSMRSLGMPGFVDVGDELDQQSQDFLGLKVEGDTLTGPLHPAVYKQLKFDLKNFAYDDKYEPRRRNYVNSDLQVAEEARHKELVKNGSTGVEEHLHAEGEFDRVVHGENHSHPDAKAELINKIQQKGKTPSTLYVELLSEFQPLVDQYAKDIGEKSVNARMPKLLAKYLDGVDALVAEKDKGGYRALIETYLRSGQHVVFVDTALAKDGSDEEREASMNQSAYEIIKRDQEANPSDYDVLVGAAHAKTQEGHPNVKGLSERLGVKAKINEDALAE